MPTYREMQDWIRKSNELIKAQPVTTRITTKYTFIKRKKKSTTDAAAERLPKQDDEKVKSDVTGKAERAGKAEKLGKKSEKSEKSEKLERADRTENISKARCKLVVKTYDPITGVSLKYRTIKAAEVSRLILSLGQMGREMAALPDETKESAPPAITSSTMTTSKTTKTPKTPTTTPKTSTVVPASGAETTAAIKSEGSSLGQAKAGSSNSSNVQAAAATPIQQGQPQTSGGGKKKKKGKK